MFSMDENCNLPLDLHSVGFPDSGDQREHKHHGSILAEQMGL
jgi:hypothetical protein